MGNIVNMAKKTILIRLIVVIFSFVIYIVMPDPSQYTDVTGHFHWQNFVEYVQVQQIRVKDLLLKRLCFVMPISSK